MLIGLSGERFSGKDTIANYLVKHYGFQHYKLAGKLKQILKIRFDLPNNWDWDKDKEVPSSYFQGYTPRQILQWYGTDGMPQELWESYSFMRHLIPILSVLFDEEISDESNLNKLVHPYNPSHVFNAIIKGGFRDEVDSSFWVKVMLPKSITSQEQWWEKHDIVISDVRFPDDEGKYVLEHHGNIVYVARDGADRVATNHASERYQSELLKMSEYYIQNNGSFESLYDTLIRIYEDIQQREQFSIIRRREKTASGKFGEQSHIFHA